VMKIAGNILLQLLIMLTLFYCIFLFLSEKDANSLMTLLLSISGNMYSSKILTDGGYIRYKPLFNLGKRKWVENIFIIKPHYILFVFVLAVIVGAYNFISLFLPAYIS